MQYPQVGRRDSRARLPRFCVLSLSLLASGLLITTGCLRRTTPSPQADLPCVGLPHAVETLGNAPPGPGKGLLIGLDSGLSLEYDASTLHLLRVRRGDFVRRHREGYVPVGEVLIDRSAQADGALAFLLKDGEPQPLVAQLEDVWVRDWADPSGQTSSTPGISYSLHDGNGQCVANVEEHARPVPMDEGWGFVRTFVLTASEPTSTIVLDIYRPVGEPHGGDCIMSGPPSERDWYLGLVGRAQGAAFRSDSGLHQLLTRSRPSDVRFDGMKLIFRASGQTTRFELAEQFVGDWDTDSADALCEQLLDETGRTPFEVR